MVGRTFGVTPGSPGRFDLTKLVPQLEALHERLAGVVIECLDFERLAAALERLEGTFLMSLNDTPEVRAIFAAFTIEGVRTTYTVSRGKPSDAREVLIRTTKR